MNYLKCNHDEKLHSGLTIEEAYKQLSKKYIVEMNENYLAYQEMRIDILNLLTIAFTNTEDAFNDYLNNYGHEPILDRHADEIEVFKNELKFITELTERYT